ncbi:SPW repeat domain-containing protein [Microvirga subterranea]|uniref:SPW repeat-containing protein n=1 Tax=Microvirga subterranea TaxID=186651 RepID=A0A370HLP3_9HYPH|nr:SPW repeat protein [Microvirga subterranea]RDI59492.1 SPW repeat-containing protein [Microvirga subterranea]
MRFLPTRVHGIIDYLWGAALLASPWILGFAGITAARWIAVAFGLGAILYSLVTAYELGLLPVLPMPLHLVLDGVAGFILAITPWGFGFAGQVVWPFVLFGLFSVAASLVTRLQPARSPGRRSIHAAR